MARKKHGGLGRGLDALIPQAPQEKTVKQEALTQETSREEIRSAQEIKSAEDRNEIHSAETDEIRAVPAEEPSSNPANPAEADFSADNSGGVQMLRLSQVDPNRSQPRKNFADEALEELADSIRQFGVLQPILVQKKGARYEIIAGERRWRACRKAGLTEIPAIVREYSDQETVELSLIENIQREDLNPIEEAKAFRRLLEEFGLRQEDLAARVSKSRTAITNAVRLLKLDDRVQNMIITEQISMGHARALLPVEIPEEQFLLAQQAAEKHLSVRDVEKMIRNRTAKKKTGKKSADTTETAADPALELAYKTIEERLKQSLGTKASIRHSGDGTGKLEIEFYSHEDLEKIVDLLT